MYKNEFVKYFFVKEHISIPLDGNVIILFDKKVNQLFTKLHQRVTLGWSCTESPTMKPTKPAGFPCFPQFLFFAFFVAS